MADAPVKGSAYKRRRVARACETCRAMKSKCDGKQPECGRCAGYGYACVYSTGRLRRRTAEAILKSEAQSTSPQAMTELRGAVGEYEDLIERLLSQLPSKAHQKEARSSYDNLKPRVHMALNNMLTFISVSDPELVQPLALTQEESPHSPTSSTPSQRYLGEVSDIHFFNLIKRLLQTRDVSSLDQDFDSYEQDGEIWPVGAASGSQVELPELEEAKKFVDVYFSTIHLAYPFIPKNTFMSFDRSRLATEHSAGVDETELAIFYVLCAIGAYYTSFPGKSSGLERLHEAYFHRSFGLARKTERSTNHVSLLLAQCFYFLAVCRTDSCWTTLGQAVRIAQSIGLHVESQTVSNRSPQESERRRRIWYSIYVLDRLLALQLGRPPAIHDDDCDVPLPSRLADDDIDRNADQPPVAEDGPSEGDYFIAVITFSRIVGRVLRDIYNPRHGQPTAEDTLGTRELDRSLLDWKTNLPRRLRFDLGHAFDQNYVFKRQRNMLAVKFHHLRALIHRPYLCYPLLRHLDDTSPTMPQADWTLVNLYEKTCVAEARETARLLHGVSSEKDLVHEFPWWQMISCLTCAGSILLVSSVFAQPSGDDRAEFDAESLHDDAETCLKMFEALSVNSKSAMIARDMMENLKKRGSEWRRRPSQSPILQHVSRLASQGSLPPSDIHTTGDFAASILTQDTALSEVIAVTPSNWPTEIGDSMAWSAQFFSAFQGSGSGE